MKKLLLLIFCIVATLTSYAQAGYDFSATNSNGYTLYYKITDPIRKRVEIVNAPGAMGMWAGYSFSGPFDVPAQVENGGVTYNVVSINVFFMLGAGHGSITTLTLYEGLETIGYTTFWQFNVGNSELIIPSTVTSYGGGAFYQTFWTAPSVRIRILNPIPASGYNGCPAFDVNGRGFGGGVTVPRNLKIIVPTDVTRAYCNETTPCGAGGYSWSSYADYYREEVHIGATGYTTYYLENENFKVPTGCTAYIITGVTPSGSVTNPDQAVVKAFTAGKIIPKQTGFVLQGPANSTVTYEANVTGTEVNVAGNLLIGTATEQPFSATGKRFYILANGDQGMGFYKQGTRGGMSIKLKAHRAGLCLDESVARAKSIVFDFDTARDEAEATGIQNVPTNGEQKDDIVYDLQGRRIMNPTHGIYIINGKKVIK